MKPWLLLDTVEIPGGPDLLRLKRRDDEFAISLGSLELMNNRRNASEKALATLACARLPDPSRAHVLIGGLGMGFTLCAALEGLGEQARVVVAELVPGVVDWARGPLAHLFGGSLADPRVELRTEDVRETIRSGRGRYHAILLDVDNGPEAFTHLDNDRLYDSAGLASARNALRPGGVLGVWSNARDRAFSARLRGAGFDVEEVRVHANGRSGRRHLVWFARRN